MVNDGRPAANDVDGEHAFTMSRKQLEDLVIQACRKAAAVLVPPLVDRQELARLLGCSPTHVDHLRKRGLPTVPVGQYLVRFEPAKVVEWLREHGAA